MGMAGSILEPHTFWYRKMAMSSLSIYKDLHDYLNQVVIDQFSFTAAGEKQLSCSSEQEIGQRIKGQL